MQCTRETWRNPVQSACACYKYACRFRPAYILQSSPVNNFVDFLDVRGGGGNQDFVQLLVAFRYRASPMSQIWIAKYIMHCGKFCHFLGHLPFDLSRLSFFNNYVFVNDSNNIANEFSFSIRPFPNTSAPARLRLPVPHVSTKPLKSSLSLHAKIFFYVWNEWIKYCKRYHYEVNRSVLHVNC